MRREDVYLITILNILVDIIFAVVLVCGMIIIARDDRTREKRIAQFGKVSLQQFREDYSNLMNMPTDCVDGMYITDEIYENIKFPTRATIGSAGYDFYSPIEFTLMPNQSITFPTGICVEIEPNWVLKMYPRSSLGIKNDAGLKNHVGIVDSDYAQSDNEGHIFCSLKNNGLRPLHVKAGDRLMQGVFVPYGITYDDNCEETRNGGIGSTNV